MLDSEEVKKINDALKNSFAAIKKDMDSIKENVSSNSKTYSEIKKQIEFIFNLYAIQ